jgi:hypothetical protein
MIIWKGYGRRRSWLMKILCRRLSVGTDEDHENLNRSSRCTGQIGTERHMQTLSEFYRYTNLLGLLCVLPVLSKPSGVININNNILKVKSSFPCCFRSTSSKHSPAGFMTVHFSFHTPNLRVRRCLSCYFTVGTHQSVHEDSQ